MSSMNRERRIAALREAPAVDVLVIGGGINGAGTFRDLALQGLRVALVDKGDFCGGASAAPSRMIHGGLRYLENGEFDLVKESLSERNRLLQNAAHYVSPLPTTIPIFQYASGVVGAGLRFFGLSEKSTKRGAAIIKLGLSLYDLYTGRSRVMPKHSFDGKAATTERWPNFPPDVKCSATYFDARISYPERLALELLQDAESENSSAVALNYVRVDGSDAALVTVTDLAGGESIQLRPKLIVNATGAWIDLTNQALSRERRRTQLIGGTKGSHLIIDSPQLVRELGDHMVYHENEDGRICIMFAYFGNLLVGSTDLKVDDPDAVRCESAERDYILDSLRRVFPSVPVTSDQILYTFCGVRPLVQSDSKTTGRISRSHRAVVLSQEQGFGIPTMCLVGGKWTTFRSFAEQATDGMLATLGKERQRSTQDLPIGGGRDFPIAEAARQIWLQELAQRFELPLERAEVLLDRYGTHGAKVAEFCGQSSAEAADAPLQSLPSYTRRELQYLCEHECVQKLEDVLLRRTNMAISGALSFELIEEVVQIVGNCLGWANERRAQELAEVLSHLAYFHGVDEGMLRARDERSKA